MNHNTLEDALRGSAADLSLDRPVGDVMARGDRLRRRRARRFAAGGVAAAAVAASALSLTLPSSTTPLVPAANAAWGPALVNLPADDLEQADQECRRILRDMGWQIPAGIKPLAADARGDVALLFYRFDGRTGDCSLERRDGELSSSGAAAGRWEELTAGTHVELIFMSYATGRLDGPVRNAAGGIRVSDAVDRLELEYAGETVEATVDSGVAMFWLPDGMTQQDLDALTITAYDAAGEVLVDGELLELRSPEQAPNDDKHL